MIRVGIDIAEVKRIARLIKDRRFLERVYTAEEIAYCMPKVNRAQHFAVRFATKEAVWKALNDTSIALRDIGVRNQPSGKPDVFINGKRRSDIDVSLSHTDDHAVAVAILMKAASRARKRGK